MFVLLMDQRDHPARMNKQALSLFVKNSLRMSKLLVS